MFVVVYLQCILQIRMYVCMYCMHVCMYVLYACMYVCTVCMYVCMFMDISDVFTFANSVA